MTGALLIRSTIHPGERFQVQMKHNGTAGDLIVDCWPDSMVRGYPANPEAEPDESGNVVGPIGVVEVSRSRRAGGKGIHQSVTMMITGTIQDELQLHLLESEQIASTIRLETVFDADGVVSFAGGVLVQLLPGADSEVLAAIIEKLESLGSIEEQVVSGGHSALLQAVAPEDHPCTLVGSESPYFGCNCSEERVLGSLTTLARDNIQEIIREGRVLEMTCGYCRKVHQVAPERLRALLEEN
jgi:molecular chaperone Hsp33